MAAMEYAGIGPRRDVFMGQPTELSEADAELESATFGLKSKFVGVPARQKEGVEQRLRSLVNAARTRVTEMQRLGSPHAEIIKVIHSATREVRTLGHDFDKQSREYHSNVREAQKTSQAISNAIGNLALPALGVGAAVGGAMGGAAVYGPHKVAVQKAAQAVAGLNIRLGEIAARKSCLAGLGGSEARVQRSLASIEKIKTEKVLRRATKAAARALPKAMIAAGAAAGAVVGGAIVGGAVAVACVVDYTLGSTSVADATLNPPRMSN